MELINKSQDQNALLQHLSRGNKFTFPTNELIENQKRISGTKRDMRRKVIKSARPTYNQNRIVNKAENGTKFLEFKPVEIPQLQENFTAPQMVDILLERNPNHEFDELKNFATVEEILGLDQNEESLDIADNLNIFDNVPVIKPVNQGTSNGFNIDAAVNYLDAHAHNKTVKSCAMYVRRALEAGGLDTRNHPESAADYVDYLGKLGFNLIVNGYGDQLPDEYSPQKGDIVVIGRVGIHKHGHIAMYNGKQWVSDFRQKSFKIYDTIKDYTIWRHK